MSTPEYYRFCNINVSCTPLPPNINPLYIIHRDKINMGRERKSAVIDPQDRHAVAYHEGGHAIMALYTPGAMPIYKATIIPRGPALGLVSCP